MKNKKTLYIAQGALIASLYVILTYISNLFGLAGNNLIQVRLSEALCILPFFTPVAIPGLFCGCLISNLMIGAEPLDMIFGSLATLLAATLSYLLRKKKFLVPLPAVVMNMLIVPPILTYAYGLEDAMWFLAVTVGAGQIISCYALGLPLLFVLEKYKTKIFSFYCFRASND